MNKSKTKVDEALEYYNNLHKAEMNVLDFRSAMKFTIWGLFIIFCILSFLIVLSYKYQMSKSMLTLIIIGVNMWLGKLLLQMYSKESNEIKRKEEFEKVIIREN